MSIALTKPRSPQTDGMVERFNGRISDVLATHWFESGEDLAQTLERCVWLYNQYLPSCFTTSNADSGDEELA